MSSTQHHSFLFPLSSFLFPLSSLSRVRRRSPVLFRPFPPSVSSVSSLTFSPLSSQTLLTEKLSATSQPLLRPLAPPVLRPFSARSPPRHFIFTLKYVNASNKKPPPSSSILLLLVSSELLFLLRSLIRHPMGSLLPHIYIARH